MSDYEIAKARGSSEKALLIKNSLEMSKVVPADGPVSGTGEPTTGLKRQIGITGTLSILIGTIIGSGIFASPSSVAREMNSAGGSLVVWTGCGVVAMFSALSWLELGCMFPNKSGGEYAYLLYAFGPIPGFLYAYINVLVTRPAALCIITLTCGDSVIEAFGGSNSSGYNKIIAGALIAVILIVNCLSVKWATLMQVFFTAAKMVAIVMLIITGLVRLGQGHNDNFKNSFNGTDTGISSVGYAFYGGLWAYDGWNNLNYVTEELKNPIRDLPLAIMVGIPLVTGCYVMVNIAYLTVMTSAEIAKSNAVAVTLGYNLYGVMAWIIPFLVACSTFGAANGSAFTSGRLVYVSAREGHMPKILAMIHKKRHTPLPALIFTCVIAWIMLIPESSNFSTLVNYFNFAAWTFYGATIAALLWLRYKEPNLKRPYKVFIGIPIFVLICSVYLVVAPFYDYPWPSFFCLLFMLMGIPVYFIFVYFKIFPKRVYNGFDYLTEKLQNFCNLAMPDDDDNEVDVIDQQKKEQVGMDTYKSNTEQM